jgi:phage tail-like protein
VSRPRGWLPARLPMGMRDDHILSRFVEMLEHVAEPMQQRIDQLPYLADASVTPLTMLPWLASMVGAEDLETLPEVQRRNFVRQAGGLLQGRGTIAQLEALVAPFSSGAYSITDDGGIYRQGQAQPCTGNVWVRLEALQYTSRDNLTKIIREAVPAHCVVWFQVGDEPMEALIR